MIGRGRQFADNRWQAGGVPEETRTTGPLRPIELATASVLAGVAVALTVIGWFLPHLGPVAALAVVPLGVVAHRHRFRALAASAFSASILSFLVAGTGTVSNIVECAVVGGFVGTALRRNWGFGVVAAAMAVIGPILAAVSVGLLFVFGSIRKLTLDQIRNTWKGIERLLRGFGGMQPVIHRADKFIAAAIRDWWITVGVIVIAATFWFAALAWVLLGPVLERLHWLRAVDRLDDPGTDGGTDGAAPAAGPVPVRFEHAGFRYHSSDVDALKDVDLSIEAGTFVALVGDNGSGKSTLARLIAGRPPTSGAVQREGGAALGRPGGTAMVMQHPETQILGVRVADDVVWGLRDAAGVDVESVLRSVGLDGMGERDTSTLSGGELQRLAVAAALARRPRLLISDESTAMVDAPGRQKLVELLSGLPGETGMTVVHVTHRQEETLGADHKYRLTEGRLQADEERPVPTSDLMSDDASMNGLNAAPVGIPALLELRDVGHTYGAGSPWAHRALEGINLSVGPGEGVLVVGSNGSGKSTLAWIMAGVLRPSRGWCTLGGEPVRSRSGAVGLAFQHARLQLQRSTVKLDLLAAGAEDEDDAAAHLAAVGLDWSELAERRIDELSGGQQRRVALAGVLARRPSVLVLDEPLAGLDRPSQDSLVSLLARLRHDRGITVVVISHDLEGMERVCDRVVSLQDGCVIFDGPRAEAPC